MNTVNAQETSALDPEFEALKTKFETTNVTISESAKKEKETLVSQYTAYLLKVEEKLQSTGNLDRVLKVREEREKLTLSGEVTTHADPELDLARQSYITKSDEIRRNQETKEAELKSAYSGRLEALEISFTKAGKIPSALAAREERQKLSQTTAQTSSPQSSALSAKFPDDTPPLAGENPFKNPGINKSITVPPDKYRLREKHVLQGPGGPKDQPTLAFAAGTDVSGTAEASLFIGRGRMIARDTAFSDLPIRGDLNSSAFFARCTIRNCTFEKAGPWAGGNFASRWHFEDTTIERTFLPELSIKNVGLRLLNSTVRGVDLPAIDFAGVKVSNAVLTEWLQVRNTRFEKCKIPLSFLLITDSCAFVDCTFIDDTQYPTLDKLITVTIYEQACTWRAKSLLINMNVKKLPLASWK